MTNKDLKEAERKIGFTPTPWDKFCWIKQLSQHRYLHVVLSVCVVGGKRKLISFTELSLESHGKQHKYVFIV